MRLLRRSGGKFLAASALLALFLVAGCAPVFSIHPLYSGQDIIFEPHLLGLWVASDNGGQMTFEQSGKNGYTMSFVDLSKKPPETDTFGVFLVRLGDKVFVDAAESEISITGHDALNVFAIPGHMLGRVALQQNSLKMSFLDDEWLQDLLKTNANVIRHEIGDDGVPVLTAATPDLQKFVQDHANDAKAFSVDFEFHRKK